MWQPQLFPLFVSQGCAAIEKNKIKNQRDIILKTTKVEETKLHFTLFWVETKEKNR